MNMVELEKPEGVIASLGGQTAINLAQPLTELGVKHHRHRLRRHRKGGKPGRL